jgi:hypothetical protein
MKIPANLLLVLLPLGATSAADRCNGLAIPNSLAHAAQRLGVASNDYVAALHDLNGDGYPEALLFLSGQGQCGSGGCPLIVLQRISGAWKETKTITITKPPIRVLANRHHGWQSLGVQVSGGGILEPYEAVLDFGSNGYPSNPTVPPAHHSRAGAPGRTLIRDYRCKESRVVPNNSFKPKPLRGSA